jgi:hypothetical protein
MLQLLRYIPLLGLGLLAAAAPEHDRPSGPAVAARQPVDAAWQKLATADKARLATEVLQHLRRTRKQPTLRVGILCARARFGDAPLDADAAIEVQQTQWAGNRCLVRGCFVGADRRVPFRLLLVATSSLRTETNTTNQVLIVRDQPVVIQVTTATLRLNVEGTAVSDARRGELLWVRNNASGRRVRCVAVAPGLVKLGGVNE